MLRYIHAEELSQDAGLEREMFRHRADQFGTRLGWEVAVNAAGEERDAYDALNPLYVIWKTPAGGHGGSMRVLPTTGPCMANDHFSHVAGGSITSPLIWESTRFCLAPDVADQAARISAALMLAACEIGLNFGLRHGLGVFDARMERIYGRIGWPPVILGSDGTGRGRVSVGVWDFTAETRHRLCLRAAVSPCLSRLWFERSFGTVPAQTALAAAG